MRALNRREKIEFFLLSPIFFALMAALLILICLVWYQIVDIGYLLACLLFGIAAAVQFNRSTSWQWIIGGSAAGMHISQIVFFGFDRYPDDYAVCALQYLVISLITLSSITTVVRLMRNPGSPTI
jgi:hypothetical protein